MKFELNVSEFATIERSLISVAEALSQWDDSVSNEEYAEVKYVLGLVQTQFEENMK